MEKLWRFCLLKLIFMFVLVVRLEAVTVNPDPCPTNKIAPRKRMARWDQSRPRTFGSFYNLFAPTAFPDDSLIEQPQEDALDDCGDIEDYDENDLSSEPKHTGNQSFHTEPQDRDGYGVPVNTSVVVTPQSQRRQGQRNNRFFNGFLYPYRGPTTRKPPVTFRPVRPSYPPTRPPYASGGVFGNNVYKTPLAQDPSVHVKPVHDGIQESQMTYRPGLVGAPSGIVVGASQVTPTRFPPPESTIQKRPRYVNNSRFPPYTTPASPSSSNRTRPKKVNDDDSILGSFISLLFK